MKAVVIYQNNHSTTEKYAFSIARELNCEVYLSEKVTNKVIESCDILIFGSPIYGCFLDGLNFLKTHWNKIRTKEIVLFSVTTDSEETPNIRKSYQMIPCSIKNKVKYFKLSENENNLLDLSHQLFETFFKNSWNQKYTVSSRRISRIVNYVKSLNKNQLELVNKKTGQM
jgi:hypothetical protein